MTTRIRLSVLAAAALMMLASTPAQARAVLDEVQLSYSAAATIQVAPPPCSDSAYNLEGGRQHNGSYSWQFDAATTPSALGRSAVLSVIKKAFNNVTGEHNDCGRPGSIAASNTYLGATTTRPNCNQPDGHNVVGFGRLDNGVLAVTCYWISGGRIAEADMKINSREAWSLSLSSCSNQIMLEATLTHEAGHVFGLDHVSEKAHGRLTLSPYIDGICENQESTLGLGDMRGLEALY